MSDELKQLRADLEVLERYYDDNYTGPNKAIRDLKSKIADLEAAADDPWRDAKQDVAYLVKSLEMRRVGELFDHLTAEVARLTARVAELEAEIRAEDDADIADAATPQFPIVGTRRVKYVETGPLAPRGNFPELDDLASYDADVADAASGLPYMHPPVEGPIVGIEPVLNPARVLRTALGLLESMFPWRSHTSPAQDAIDFVRRHTDASTKPYPLKKGGE